MRLLPLLALTALLALLPALAPAQWFLNEVDGERRTVRHRRAPTDCTAETGGKIGELCVQVSDAALFVCNPTGGESGICDTAGEWEAISGGGGSVANLEDVGDVDAGAADGDMLLRVGGAWTNPTVSAGLSGQLFTANGQVLMGTGSGTGAVTGLLAGVGGLLTNGRIPYVSGSLTDSIDLQFNGIHFGAGSGARAFMKMNADSAANSPGFTFRTDTNTGMWRVGAGILGFSTSSVNKVTIGGSYTLLCNDETTSTGNTICRVKSGAGQTSNPFQVVTAADANLFAVRLASAGGGIQIGDGGTRPTCDSGVRGTIHVDEGAGGVKDAVAVCAKDAADAYDWRTIY